MWTSAPSSRANSAVPSVLPPSTTSTWSANCALRMQALMRLASFSVRMAIVSVAIRHLRNQSSQTHSMAVRHVLARFESVHGPAVGTTGFAGLGHVQVDLGVAVPEFHVGQGAGAVHAAVGVEVLGGQFDGGVGGGQA